VTSVDRLYSCCFSMEKLIFVTHMCCCSPLVISFGAGHIVFFGTEFWPPLPGFVLLCSWVAKNPFLFWNPVCVVPSASEFSSWSFSRRWAAFAVPWIDSSLWLSFPICSSSVVERLVFRYLSHRTDFSAGCSTLERQSLAFYWQDLIFFCWLFNSVPLPALV
jgi:hypothetical protein